MNRYILAIGGRQYRAEVLELGPERARVVVDGTEYAVDLVEISRPTGKPAQPVPAAPPAAPRPAPPPRAGSRGSSEGAVAPLPGLVVQVKVREGDSVRAGQPLLVMEAMKMENVIPAPYNGTVSRVLVKEGDNVSEGDLLLLIARPDMTTL